MNQKPTAIYRLEPRRKYTFGETQNAMTARGVKIIIPNEVAKDPAAWAGKSFPVKAFSLDRLGWYRPANHAEIVRVQPDGFSVVKFV